MQTVTALAPYEDERGNRIVVPEGFVHDRPVSIVFRGSNNVLRVGRKPRIGLFHVQFDSDGGKCVIAGGTGAFACRIRVGQDAVVKIGRNTTTTEPVGISAVEGARVLIGEDVMIATHVQIRSDDGHPIFDVRSRKRINPARTIKVGDHVWLGWGATVLGGSVVGDGSVIGMGAVLKGKVPNNAIATGVPARTVRRDIAWERPHLSLDKPYYKPDADSVVTHEQWWNLTEEDAAAAGVVTSSRRGPRELLARAKARLRR